MSHSDFVRLAVKLNCYGISTGVLTYTSKYYGGFTGVLTYTSKYKGVITKINNLKGLKSINKKKKVQ